MRISMFSWMVVTLVGAGLLLSPVSFVVAAADEKPKTTGDSILPEFALGSFSAALGWGASALITFPLRTSTLCQQDSLTFNWCALLWVAGPSLTAPIGVIAVGELSGVQGNNPFAFLGSILAGFSLFSCIAEPQGFGATLWCQALELGGLGMIVYPALLATLGYNFRAYMKADFLPSTSLVLPFFSARFKITSTQ
ncbi:hypothetical protein HYR54_04230 [Candidatus Acetothermia bacterium]|nr:hypothetical protein [Candidatus Acetothermia bacterium]MBI3460642.1 hypothetical protein [Candidatus Acetothermia bacterium]